MSEELNLKGCPFCGMQGEVAQRHNPMSKWKWSVDCADTTCGMSGPVEASPAEAIAAWNLRSPATERDSAIEECAKVAEEYPNNHVNGPAITPSRHRRDIAAAIRVLKSANPSALQTGEALEQFADRIVSETRRAILSRIDDDVIGQLRESHLIFAKGCVIAAISVCMKEGAPLKAPEGERT